MFCPKCGRLVNDNALFCTFCGCSLREMSDNAPDNTPGSLPVSPLSEPVPAPMSAPVSASMSARVSELASPLSEPVSAPMSARVSSPVSELASPLSEPVSAPVYAADKPNDSGETAFNEVTGIPAVKVASESALAPKEVEMISADDIENPPAKVEKYYSFGHIALCLAAVALMAIVAGVFAGLYFSVI